MSRGVIAECGPEAYPQSMSFRKLMCLFRDTFNRYYENGGSYLGAAVAFYAVLSLAPMMMIVLALVDWLLGDPAAGRAIGEQLSGVVEPHAAGWLIGLIEHLESRGGSGGRAGTIGTVLLAYSGTRLFAQLQGAMNQLCGVRAPTVALKVSLLATLYRQLQALVMVVSLGGALAAFLVLSSSASVLKGLLGTTLPGSDLLWAACTMSVTLVLLAAVFTLLFRALPDGNLPLRDCAVGASATALLFAISEYPLTFYLGRQGIDSVYGAAGGLILFLLWVYYASQVFFMGAQFTVVWSESRGRGITFRAPSLLTNLALGDDPLASQTPTQLAGIAQTQSRQMNRGMAESPFVSGAPAKIGL